MKFLDENSSVDASIRRADGVVDHESFDAVDLIESGTTLDQIVADYKAQGVQVVTVQIAF